MEERGQRLGEVLVAKGVVTAEQLKDALETQRGSDSRLGEILLARGLLGEAALRWALAEQLDLPLVHPEPASLDPEALSLVPSDVCRRYGVIPLHLVAESPGGELVLTVAAADPSLESVFADLAARSGHPVRVVAALREEVEAALETVYGPASRPDVSVLSGGLSEEGAAQVREDPSGESLLRRLLGGLLTGGGSVLHLRARAGKSRVEEDGGRIVFEGGGAWHAILLDRLRQLAGFYRAGGRTTGRVLERGRFTFPRPAGGEPALFRVSIVRGVEGEEAQIRALPREGLVKSLTDLGFTAHQSLQVRQSLAKPGLVWVTAAEDDGLGSTLFALAREIPGRGRTFTVEDEVHYRTPDFLQLETLELGRDDRGEVFRELKSLDFPRILVDRASPSQLGDLLALAVRRRWVLAGAPEASFEESLALLARRSSEIPLYGLSLVIHQRLVPILCRRCRIEAVLGTAERRALTRLLETKGPLYQAGEGCDECGGRGTRGRKAYFEILPVDASVREALYGQARGEQRLDRLLDSVTPRIAAQVAAAAVGGEVSLSEVWDFV